jgi:hypothetical protein
VPESDKYIKMSQKSFIVLAQNKFNPFLLLGGSPSGDLIKPFSSSLTLEQNKLECLSLTNFSVCVCVCVCLSLINFSEPIIRVGHCKKLYLGRLHANIRLP